MIRTASFVMAFYSTAMVFYGGAELVHDFLHYLADHHHATLHSHSHGGHHTLHDHKPHHHDSFGNHVDAEVELPALISFFLFVLPFPAFLFGTTASEWRYHRYAASGTYSHPSPPSPPPRAALTIAFPSR